MNHLATIITRNATPSADLAIVTLEPALIGERIANDGVTSAAIRLGVRALENRSDATELKSLADALGSSGRVDEVVGGRGEKLVASRAVTGAIGGWKSSDA